MTGEGSFQTLKLWPPHFGHGGQASEPGTAGVIKSEFPIGVLARDQRGLFSDSPAPPQVGKSFFPNPVFSDAGVFEGFIECRGRSMEMR